MPSCVLPQGVPQVQTESRGIECPEAVWPDRALCLQTCSQLLIVNKLLSLSLSLLLLPFGRRTDGNQQAEFPPADT